VSEELPEGWAVASLFDVCNPKQWLTIPTKDLVEDGYPVYGANGQIGFYSEYNHEKPTLLITCRGATCGTLNISNPFSYVTGNAMCLDDLEEAVCGLRFLFYALTHRGLNDAISGSAQPQITRRNLEVVDFPIAPVREQKRIVATLDTYTDLVRVVTGRLYRIPAILKRFRQAVLVSACSGRLTEDWRQAQSVGSLDTERLVQELAEQCKRSGIDWFEPRFDNREQYPLPEGWKYVALGVLGTWGSGGTPSKSVPSYWSQGDYPWVSPKDMKTDFLADSQDHLTKLGASQLKVIPKDSILFVVRGMILAHTFPVAMAMRELTINQDIRAVSPHAGVSSGYLLRALQREAVSILFAVRESTHGTRRLESETLKVWPIPLPSPYEQQEIVHRVEGLFRLADTIEHRVSVAKLRADKLTQSILTRAFRGELVLTEAELARREGREYEPASVLVERIQAEKANQTKTPPVSKRKLRKASAHV